MVKDPWIGREIAGCLLLSQLGEGAMASVYRARQREPDGEVAVKILHPQMAQEERVVQFFLREARSASKLHHPNIVEVYRSGQEGDAHFIVMQLVQGRTLREWVKSEGPLAVPRATSLMIDVFLALAAAHLQDIVHRDIKPSNILVTKEGRAMLADFGLARSVNEERRLTLTGEVIGTAYFIAPEQALGKTIDGRADLYSAGASYYFLLTGSHPFEGQNAVEVIHRQINDPLRPASRVNPKIPENVSRIIDRLMAKRPEDRYPNARAVLEDLYVLREAGSDPAPGVQASGGLVFTGFNDPFETNAALASPEPPGEEVSPRVVVGKRPPEPSNPGLSSPARTSSPWVSPGRRRLALGLYALACPCGAAIGMARSTAGGLAGIAAAVAALGGAVALAPNLLTPTGGAGVGAGFLLSLVAGILGGEGSGAAAPLGGPAGAAWGGELALAFLIAGVFCLFAGLFRMAKGGGR